MKKAKLLLLGCLMLMVALPVFAAEEIKVGGGGASIATVFKGIKVPFKKLSGISVITIQSTPKNGLIELEHGLIDIATAAGSLDEMITAAEKEGVKVDPASLEKLVVAQNRTVIFVHPSNQVSKLSKEQIKGIFTGKITNWKEVGGSDAPILLIWGKLTPGQNALFSKMILDDAPLTKNIINTSDYMGIKDTVAAIPEAIGIAPFALGAKDKAVKIIKTDPAMLSDIIIVTKGKPSAKVQKLISFIQGDGKKYIIQ